MRRIVLLGGTGQLGWELERSLAPLGELIALERDGVTWNGSSVPLHDVSLCGDLRLVEKLTKTIRALRPDVIVNAAAYTSVDKAETERDLAEAVNARAPAALARLSREMGALLVHYSTDYVFDGTGNRPWREDDPTVPLNVYGRTKLEGEERIRDSGCQYLILRTSWLYSARGVNFPKTILRLATERDHLRVVSDQIGAPTRADLLADITAHVLRILASHQELGGTYHVAASGEASRFDYACFVVEQARARGWPVQVAAGSMNPLPSSAHATSAQRPKNSRLSSQKLERAFGLRMPAWQRGVERLVHELVAA